MTVERSSDRWVSLVQSVLLHGSLVAVAAYGYWVFKQRSQPQVAQTVGIEAVALHSDALKPITRRATPPPAPPPPPEPEEPAGPPTPTPDEISQREEAQRLEEERKVEERRVEVEKRQAAEKETQARETAERKKREDAEAKRVAEQKRLAEIKRKEEERKKDEARLREQREQELQRSLEEEEHLMAARSSGALASWQAQITARIQRAWLRPASAKPGIDCVVYVSQVPGGEVTNVRVGACNGDQAVRESIETAVYRASPLPPPPDPALFERNLEIRFKPVD
jgi:colicin import membrane protein